MKYLDADGNICTMDNAILNRKIDELAAKAMRVLAFGYSEKDMVENSINDDIVIIGLVAFVTMYVRKQKKRSGKYREPVFRSL